MNLKNSYSILTFSNKYVSGIVIALLVASSLVILLPFSTNTALGYMMPINTSWDMDDLVTNFSGAVTSTGPDEYTVHEDIIIPVNSSLYVFAGETVYFDLGTGITVFGYFSGIGNDTASATFTSSEVDPTFGDWDGITFESGSGVIDHASVSFAENGVYLINTSFGIFNSEFTSNVWGIHISGGGGEITGNSFTENGILPHPDPF